MTDRRLVELFFERREQALEQTEKKYGAYLRAVALNVSGDTRDAEECVNEALLRAWNSIPPARPDDLKLYLAKLTRNLAVDGLRRASAGKRGGTAGEIISELSDAVPSPRGVEDRIEQKELGQAINRFLAKLPARERDVFMMRYWYMWDTAKIAASMRLKPSNVYTILSRTREKLREALKKEGHFE